MQFKLKSKYKPTGDQPQAIDTLVESIKANHEHQVLLGVTGSGKTFSVANVIQQLQKPTLIISHNKTLAGQLYQEFRDYFPDNAVSYFVSYYDYYQPEAYIPTTDTYIEKETDINEEIDKLRLLATTNLQTRDDVIVVASVSCIYNLGDPEQYSHFVMRIKPGDRVEWKQFLLDLTKLQYTRSDYDLKRGSFRVKGDTIDIWPAYTDEVIRLQFLGNTIEKMQWLDSIDYQPKGHPFTDEYWLFPAKHYIADPAIQDEAFAQIRKDLALRLKQLKANGKKLEAFRLEQRVNYDLDMIAELGFVNGIENYSRYFDGRQPGDPPYTLIDYFRQKKDWLLVIDESHITIPQIGGMFKGDQSRKKTLIEYGFRLPSALDDRPLQFYEFLSKIDQSVYVSATPGDWELERPKVTIAEQLIRPTGLVDPDIEIRNSEGQIEDLAQEITKRKHKGQRVLVTTLTKRLAEALTEYLNEHIETSPGLQPSLSSKKRRIFPSPSRRRQANEAPPDEVTKLKVAYLHSDIDTLERQDILDDLRKGEYDVLVGINLLREGLDLPEVSLVAILDADKEGFLRSHRSLIQTMGRAARHVEGHVIMYADKITRSMQAAMDEVKRRRKVQLAYNKKHNITPQSIQKEIRKRLIKRQEEAKKSSTKYAVKLTPKGDEMTVEEIHKDDYAPEDIKTLVKRLKRAMLTAAKDLEFEKATRIRDKIREIES